MKPQFLQDFLQFKSIDHRSSPLTLAAYRQDLRALGQWADGREVEMLEKSDLRRFVSDMEEQGLADATLRRRWSAFRQYYDFVRDEGLVEALTGTPTRGFKFAVADRQESFHLEMEQRRQLFGYLERCAGSPIGKLDLALFGLLYFAALRVTEGVSRTFEDLSEDNGHQRVQPDAPVDLGQHTSCARRD